MKCRNCDNDARKDDALCRSCMIDEVRIAFGEEEAASFAEELEYQDRRREMQEEESRDDE